MDSLLIRVAIVTREVKVILIPFWVGCKPAFKDVLGRRSPPITKISLGNIPLILKYMVKMGKILLGAQKSLKLLLFKFMLKPHPIAIIGLVGPI